MICFYQEKCKITQSISCSSIERTHVSKAGIHLPLLVLFRLSESCLQAAPAVYKSVSGKQFHFHRPPSCPLFSVFCFQCWPAHPLISLSASNALCFRWKLHSRSITVNAACATCTARLYIKKKRLKYEFRYFIVV